MRHRLILAFLATLAAITAAAWAPHAADPATAQTSPPGQSGPGDSDGGWGDDQQAGGAILGDGAEVVAEDGLDLGVPSRPRAGGGDVVCRYYHDLVGRVDLSQPEPPALQELQDAGQAVVYVRVCEDSRTGELVSWAENIALDLPAVDPIDPRQLAVMARNRLPFPLPEVAFSPPLENPDDFLLVQFPAWIWVENWATESRSASAGGVVATVRARPVRQSWDFTPERFDPSTEGGCEGPGTPFDPSRPAGEQSTACTVTFRHSSAAEPDDVFDGRVTVVYEVSWTSNIGLGGSLGSVARTSTVPVRVGEQQALNESGGTEQ